MKKIIIFFLLSISVLISANADPTEPVTPTGFGLSVGDWIQPTLSGQTQAGSGGTLIDFKSQLGLKNQSIIIPHFWYRWAHGQIFDFRYQQLSQAGSAVLSVPETYQGISFAPGSTINTNMKLQWADVTYELPIAYDRYPPQDSYFNALMDVRLIKGTFTIANAAGASSQHPPITVPFPMLGVHGKARLLSDTDLEYKIAGITAGFEDAIGWSYDAEIGLDVNFLSSVAIAAKYRYSNFYNRDADNNIFGYRLYGPEVDLNFQF